MKYLENSLARIKAELEGSTQNVCELNGRTEYIRLDRAGVELKICDAVGCCAEAKTMMDVKVGDHRAISLSLCNDCVCKFRDEQQ